MDFPSPPPDRAMRASTIAAQWRRGEAPDLAALMAPVDRSDDDAWREALLADAERRSERGLAPTLGHYLSICPWLRPGSRTVQELLAVEVADMPADPAGPEPRLLDRYGQPFADDIRIVVELHALLQAVPSERRAVLHPDPQPGAAMGKYRLHRTLGRGAFGQVWLAWDDELECFVALKLIPRAGDSDRRTALLLAEARAASSLNHPNVVSVRAAGRFPTPGDWLYIEMQLCGDPAPTREEPKAVAVGQPLTEARSRLGNDWRSVARTMADIARGVVAAHAQGVVHCDLKPANVLVTPSGRAMVADFGLSASDFLPVVDASASPDQTHGMAMSLTLQAAAGKAIRGTPAYMSPEQARGESAKPISDVYGLGAVLFWLLSGQDPYKARSGENWRTLLDRVGDVTQPTPALPSGAHPTLERICRKAMRKRPEERYLSASAMLADLEALLDRRVTAGVGPDSAWQPLALWTRRNALPVSIAAVAIVGLTTLTGVAMAQRAEAEQQRARADERAVAAEAAEKAEKERADQLKKVSDFQSGMLGQIDTKSAGEGLMADVRERFAAALEKAGVPEADRTTRIDALQQELVRVNATDAAAAMIDRTILKPAIKTIDEQFKDDPATDASLRQALASLYQSIGLYEAAFPLQESALASRRRTLGEEDPDTLDSINSMGLLLWAQGRLAEAEPYWREALEKRRRTLGEEHPDTLDSIGNMGSLLRAQGRLAEAEPYLREDLEKSRRTLGEEHPDTLVSLRLLVRLKLDQGRAREALDLITPYEPAARKAFTDGNARRLADFLTGFGRARVGVGYDAERFALAESNLLEAHPIYVAAKDRGPTHKDTLECARALVDLYSAWDAAEPGKGYDAKAAEWRAKLPAPAEPVTPSSPTP